jgi:hypothetical protein
MRRLLTLYYPLRWYQAGAIVTLPSITVCFDLQFTMMSGFAWRVGCEGSSLRAKLEHPKSCAGAAAGRAVGLGLEYISARILPSRVFLVFSYSGSG